jgi:hypothetical protein
MITDEMIRRVADEFFVYHPTIDPQGVMRLWVPKLVVSRIIQKRLDERLAKDNEEQLTATAPKA